MLSHYFSIGLGVYLGVSILNRHTFKGATPGAVARGMLLGFVLWPVALWLLYFFKLTPRRRSE